MQLAKLTALSILALSAFAGTRAAPHFGAIASELSRRGQIPLKAGGLESTPARKLCGASFKHVGGLVLEKTDMDARMYVEGTIARGKLILKLGDVKERDIRIKNVLLPIETINYKCIHIRQTNLELPTIVCLESKSMRNFWINSITDAVLCSETSIRGKLPDNQYTAQAVRRDETLGGQTPESAGGSGTETEGNGSSAQVAEAVDASGQNENGTAEETQTVSETSQGDEEAIEAAERASLDAATDQSNESKINLLKEEYEDDVESKKNGKGIKLRIAKGKYGYPKIKINGTDMEEVQKSQS